MNHPELRRFMKICKNNYGQISWFEILVHHGHLLTGRELDIVKFMIRRRKRKTLRTVMERLRDELNQELPKTSKLESAHVLDLSEHSEEVSDF